MLPLLDRAFGAWQAGGDTLNEPVPAARQLASAGVTIVDVPGAEQSQIRIGWVGVSRSTPDYFPLQVLNTVLGGSFTRPVACEAGDVFLADYGRLGAIHVRFT